MDTIKVTFPLNIAKEKVKIAIEDNIRTNSRYTCKVVFDKVEDGENCFLISADEAEVFYLIGMTASIIIAKYNS